MTNEEYIEEILFEAAKYGLLNEVLETAKKILFQDPKMDRAMAYQIALEEWVK